MYGYRTFAASGGQTGARVQGGWHVSERFEDISRQLAGTTSRRGVLKMFGMAAAGAVAASVFKPFRGEASVVCSGPGSAQAAPCLAGQTPCGSCCCTKGVACLDASTGKCGCPPKTTPCGDACCNKGVACASVANSTCSGTGNVNSCNTGGPVCGDTCCPADQCCNSGVCGTCVPPSVCTSGGDICTSAPACPGSATCSCVTRAGSGTPVCVDTTGGPTGACTSDADCSGNICTSNSCTSNLCYPPCSTGA
jgi:hypothetical protein